MNTTPNKKKIGSSLIVISMFLSATVSGQVQSGNTTVADPKVFSLAEVKKMEIEESQQNFAGLNFGTGISLTIDTGNNDRVQDAQIVNGIVRASDVNDTTARIMLESHYFFLPNRSIFNVDKGNWGVGPFVALQPGTDEIIEAAGMGIMIGFKRPDKSTNSWNLGIGYVVDPNVRILGDGFIENEMPPDGEDQIRYKEKSQGGWLILASFGF